MKALVVLQFVERAVAGTADSKLHGLLQMCCGEGETMQRLYLTAIWSDDAI